MNDKLIIFDFNRTLYDPDRGEMVEGAKLILEKYFKSKIKMVLVSRMEKARKDMVKEMDLVKYFSDILFVMEKNEKLFKSLLEKYNSKKVYVVGDYLYEEIRSGNINNMETIWIKNGKFKDMKPRDRYDVPKHIVSSISEITTIIK